MKMENLPKYDNTSLEIYKVGWMNKNDTFQKEDIHNNNFRNIIKKLFNILEKERVNLVRGISLCPFCPKETGKIKYKSKLLGISEIWIPNQENTKIFTSPDLIIHYMEHHNYKPVQEFIDAVNDFDLNSDWSGKEQYDLFIKTQFG